MLPRLLNTDDATLFNLLEGRQIQPMNTLIFLGLHFEIKNIMLISRRNS